MINHYEDIYQQNKLKSRIKDYIQRVQRGRGTCNGKDQDIKDLMKVVKSNKPAA